MSIRQPQQLVKSSIKRGDGGHAKNEGNAAGFKQEDSRSAPHQSKGDVRKFREGKQGKISTSWRWAIEKGASPQDLTSHLKPSTQAEIAKDVLDPAPCRPILDAGPSSYQEQSQVTQLPFVKSLLGPEGLLRQI